MGASDEGEDAATLRARQISRALIDAIDSRLTPIVNGLGATAIEIAREVGDPLHPQEAMAAIVGALAGLVQRSVVLPPSECGNPNCTSPQCVARREFPEETMARYQAALLALVKAGEAYGLALPEPIVWTRAPADERQLAFDPEKVH